MLRRVRGWIFAEYENVCLGSCHFVTLEWFSCLVRTLSMGMQLFSDVGDLRDLHVSYLGCCAMRYAPSRFIPAYVTQVRIPGPSYTSYRFAWQPILFHTPYMLHQQHHWALYDPMTLSKHRA